MSSALRPAVLTLALGAALAAGQERVAPQKDPTGGADLPKKDADEISKARLSDLKRYMDQAQNALSPAGQDLLKAKARLRVLQKKAKANVELYAADEEVGAVGKVLGEPAVQNKLGELAGQKDKDAQTVTAEVAKYLKEQGVELTALRRYAVARTNQTLLQVCDEALKEIQAALDRTSPGGPIADDLNPDLSDLERAQKILASIRGKAGEKVEPPAAATGDDIRDILKAILPPKK